MLNVESTFDQQRALDLIGQQAVLEFRLVKLTASEKLSSAMTEADLESVAFTGEILSNARADFNRIGNATIGGAVSYFSMSSNNILVSLHVLQVIT